MTTNKDMQASWQANMMNNYRVPPIALARGKGCTVWDVEGTEYLDLIAGIATSTLGHAHPAIVAAVSNQVATLAHSSNLFAHEPGLALAQRLLSLADTDGKVFFSQDGATANEAAYKLARRHGWLADPTGNKLDIVAVTGGFHGRTMGALSITGNEAKRTPFEPLPGPVTFVPFGDFDALAHGVTSSTAAVFLEPILGEGGVVPTPDGYLAAARAYCDTSNALLVIDEVQSGVGRTGNWFASFAAGVIPDVMTLAKGLAGGLPLGACIAFGGAATLFEPGDHGSTFGGNPVSCAAALAVLDTIQTEDLLTHVKSVGDRWRNSFAKIDHPLLAGNRGVGLLQALTLTGPHAVAFEVAARNAGYLVNAVVADVIRLAPPLILSLAQADAFAQALPAILDDTQADITKNVIAQAS